MISFRELPLSQPTPACIIALILVTVARIQRGRESCKSGVRNLSHAALVPSPSLVELLGSDVHQDHHPQTTAIASQSVAHFLSQGTTGFAPIASLPSANRSGSAGWA